MAMTAALGSSVFFYIFNSPFINKTAKHISVAEMDYSYEMLAKETYSAAISIHGAALTRNDLIT